MLPFVNCSNSSNENSIIGTWQLIETYGSDGGSNPEWTTVENGYIYTFYINGNFTSNRFSECLEGNYTISENNLILDYGCTDFNTGIETPAGTFIEDYTFEGEYLILTPTYLTCIEGCSYKFKKTNNQ